LAKSIAQHGLLQPIIVQATEEGRYRIIAGHRRFIAHKLLGHRSILARIVDATDVQADVLALTENVERQALNPLEEAMVIRRIIEHGRLTQGEVAEVLGKDRTWVVKRLALLDLDEDTMNAVLHGDISASQALELKRIDDPDLRAHYLRVCVEQGATVRQLRRWIEQIKHGQAPNNGAPARTPKAFKQPKFPCAVCGCAYDLKDVKTLWVCKRCIPRITKGGDKR